MKHLSPFNLAVCSALLTASSASLGHHSFAPHFDSSKPMTIEGTVVEFEQRNPHAYLHIRAEDADGRRHLYRCESHGVTQLERNEICSRSARR
jgi:hypothetical protein